MASKNPVMAITQPLLDRIFIMADNISNAHGLRLRMMHQRTLIEIMNHYPSFSTEAHIYLSVQVLWMALHGNGDDIYPFKQYDWSPGPLFKHYESLFVALCSASEQLNIAENEIQVAKKETEDLKGVLESETIVIALLQNYRILDKLRMRELEAGDVVLKAGIARLKIENTALKERIAQLEGLLKESDA